MLREKRKEFNLEVSKLLGADLRNNGEMSASFDLGGGIYILFYYDYRGKKVEATLRFDREYFEGKGADYRTLYNAVSYAKDFDPCPEMGFNPDKGAKKVVADIKKRLIEKHFESYAFGVTALAQKVIDQNNKDKDREEKLKSLAPKSFRNYRQELEFYKSGQWVELGDVNSESLKIQFKDKAQLDKVLPEIIKLMEFN